MGKTSGKTTSASLCFVKKLLENTSAFPDGGQAKVSCWPTGQGNTRATSKQSRLQRSTPGMSLVCDARASEIFQMIVLMPLCNKINLLWSSTNLVIIVLPPQKKKKTYMHLFIYLLIGLSID